jgi:Na+/H+ antiporter NhaD/arsenite permease-like protein
MLHLKRLKKFMLVLLILASLPLLASASSITGYAYSDDVLTLTVIGRVLDSRDHPVEGAEVRVYFGEDLQPLAVSDQATRVVVTDQQGYYLMDLTASLSQIESATVAIEISNPGFLTTRKGFSRQRVVLSGDRNYVSIEDVVLPRVFNPAFYLSAAIFVVVFLLISLNLLHETIAAFLGVAGMLGISYFFGHANSDYWIVGFQRAVSHIDFDVIFLLMTMMIFMAVMSQTGVFQWLAFRTYSLSGGKSFIVTLILVCITGLISAVLNDTTVMLLMAPVSIQIALALDIHPAAIVVPEVLASNIGGAATLIGTPPNTIIGSYVGLSFNQFLGNMVPIALIGMVLLLIMIRRLYRKEYDRKSKAPSAAMLERLEAGAQITDHVLLRRSLIVFGITLVLFFVADLFHMPPAVVAILGSTALLFWTRPTMGKMLREVDWTTLVFFMSLFMMVGGLQEVGLIQLIAEGVSNLAGENLLLATMMVIWVSAVASAIVANIPFTAAIVPVAVFLSRTIPGAENNVLYWALALGAGLGGNATYIGSAPNIVAAGILDRAGYRLKFEEFARVGVPVTFVTVAVPTIWILIRYFWLKF